MSDELKPCPFCGGEAKEKGARTNLSGLICETDGATQESVAKAVGCCKQTIAALEMHPVTTVREKTIRAVAGYFGVSTDYLTGRSKSFTPHVACTKCGAMAKTAELWNARSAVTDGQFATAVHDGEAWQAVRECEMIEMPTGEKAAYSDTDEVIWHCRFCHAERAVYAFGEDGDVRAEQPKYCPSCGAKVVG